MEQNEQQFYELDASGQPVVPQQAPAPKPPQRGWLRSVVIILALLIVALLVVWLVRALISDRSVEMTQEEFSSVYATIEDELAECAQESDQAYCRDRAWIGAAREFGNPEVCFQAQNEAGVTGCVSDIAYTQMNVDHCRFLDGDDQEACRDNIRYEQIVEELDYASCAELSDETLVGRCELAIELAAGRSGDCAQAGVDTVVCDEQRRLQEAIDSGDFRACYRLARSINIESCKDTFHSLDQDGDGLTLYDEYLYGTSDKMADTDGDGYSDAVEIESGFNPLGE